MVRSTQGNLSKWDAEKERAVKWAVENDGNVLPAKIGGEELMPSGLWS